VDGCEILHQLVDGKHPSIIPEARLHETQLDLRELGHELQQQGDGIAAGNHGEQDLHCALHLRN